MDIFKFIKSKAVKQYLKELKYSFSSLDYAYLVWRSDAPLKVKHKAWKEIIDTMPDFQISFSEYAQEISLHKHLSELIDCQNRLLMQFYHQDGGVFSYSYFDCNTQYFKDGGKDIESFALALILAKCDIEHLEADVKNYLYIDKTYPNSSHALCLATNVKGQALKISFDGKLDGELKKDDNILNLLGCIHWSIPTPFKVGDILHTPYDVADEKFVLLDCDKLEGYRLYCSEIENFIVFDSVLNLEYTSKRLADKQLQFVSDYLKGKIDLVKLIKLCKKEFIEREERHLKRRKDNLNI